MGRPVNLLWCRTSKDVPARVGKAPGAPGTTASLEQLPAGELARKLAESQQMIARFSRENERLANQNEQLTGSKQVVANDYKGNPESHTTLPNCPAGCTLCTCAYVSMVVTLHTCMRTADIKGHITESGLTFCSCCGGIRQHKQTALMHC